MKIEELVQEKKWKELITNFNHSDIVKELCFFKAIKLSHLLLYNEKWDENIQEFAIKLLEAIMVTHPKEWNSSWQYDAFLGLAYDITLKYDERYEAFKRALEKVSPPPPQLLIAMAGCCICPGSPLVSYDQAIEYLNLALKDYLYVDGVGLMRAIYSLKNDIKNENYWTKIFKEIENHNIESPSLDPDFRLGQA